MKNSTDPDQLAASKVNWSGSTLFAKTGHDVFSKRRVKEKKNLFSKWGKLFSFKVVFISNGRRNQFLTVAPTPHPHGMRFRYPLITLIPERIARETRIRRGMFQCTEWKWGQWLILFLRMCFALKMRLFPCASSTLLPLLRQSSLADEIHI